MLLCSAMLSPLDPEPPCVTSDRNEITIVLQHLDNDIASGKVKENRIA